MVNGIQEISWPCVRRGSADSVPISIRGREIAFVEPGGGDGSSPAVCRWSDTDLDGTFDTWVSVALSAGVGTGDVVGPSSSTDNPFSDGLVQSL